MNNLWMLTLADVEDVASTEGEPLAAADQAEGAETGTIADGSVEGTDGKPEPVGFFENPINIVLIVLMFVFIYFAMFRGPKKKQQEHAKMVNALKKNDKVCTIGGIYGTIIEIRDKEIVLKIDESNNTKIKVTHWAVRNVAAEEREK